MPQNLKKYNNGCRRNKTTMIRTAKVVISNSRSVAADVVAAAAAVAAVNVDHGPVAACWSRRSLLRLSSQSLTPNLRKTRKKSGDGWNCKVN